MEICIRLKKNLLTKKSQKDKSQSSVGCSEVYLATSATHQHPGHTRPGVGAEVTALTKQDGDQ